MLLPTPDTVLNPKFGVEIPKTVTCRSCTDIHTHELACIPMGKKRPITLHGKSKLHSCHSGAKIFSDLSKIQKPAVDRRGAYACNFAT